MISGKKITERVRERERPATPTSPFACPDLNLVTSDAPDPSTPNDPDPAPNNDNND